MNMLNWFQRSAHGKFEKSHCPVLRKMSLVFVVCSFFYGGGCSAPPEPTPTPSKQEIQSDADRFFEKMEQEKQGKPRSH